MCIRDRRGALGERRDGHVQLIEPRLAQRAQLALGRLKLHGRAPVEGEQAERGGCRRRHAQLVEPRDAHGRVACARGRRANRRRASG
eukprot:5233887-Prymnesium_polylepis.1